MKDDLNPNTVDYLIRDEAIKKLQSQLDKMKAEFKSTCQHWDYRPVYVQTEAFEFTPVLTCVCCGYVSADQPTEYQKVELLKKHFAQAEIVPSEATIAKHKDGFNPYRPE